jgi:glyoxylase I family protein
VRLGLLMIFVPDLDEAERFYAGTLGLPVKARAGGRLVFACEGADLVAFRCARSGAVGDYAREARAVFAFEVPSLDAALQGLRAKGVRVLHDEPGENEFGRYAAFVDPFGIVHEVFEPRREVPAGEAAEARGRVEGDAAVAELLLGARSVRV